MKFGFESAWLRALKGLVFGPLRAPLAALLPLLVFAAGLYLYLAAAPPWAPETSEFAPIPGLAPPVIWIQANLVTACLIFIALLAVMGVVYLVVDRRYGPEPKPPVPVGPCSASRGIGGRARYGFGALLFLVIGALPLHLGLSSLPEFGVDTTTTVQGCITRLALVHRGRGSSKFNRYLEISLDSERHRYLMAMNMFWRDDHPVWTLRTGDCVELRVPRAVMPPQGGRASWRPSDVDVITLSHGGQVVNDDSWNRWLEPLLGLVFALVWIVPGLFLLAHCLWLNGRRHRRTETVLKVAMGTLGALFFVPGAAMLVVHMLGIAL